MKQFTQEQQERAIDILTRVLKNEGWQNSEVAKLLDEVKPKIFICRIENQSISFLHVFGETRQIYTSNINSALNFDCIEEAREYLSKVQKHCGFYYRILFE